MKIKSPWSQGRQGFGTCMLHELAEVLKAVLAVSQALHSKVDRQQDPESVLAITMGRRCLEPKEASTVVPKVKDGAWTECF